MITKFCLRTLPKTRIAQRFSRFKLKADFEGDQNLQKIFENGLNEWTKVYMENKIK